MANGDQQSVPRPGEPNTGYFGFAKMRGLNTRLERTAIDNEQFSWMENLFPVGPGTLRSLPTNAAPIYTAPKPIIYFFPFNITSGAGTFNLIAVFLNDGRAFQVSIDNGAVVAISNVPATFYDVTAVPPACAQWGASGILIVAKTTNPNTYWAWDGTNLFGPGSPVPVWLGTGTMPTGVRGSYVETFGARAWIDNGTTKLFSAPSNGANFSTGGGGAFGSSDSFLRSQFSASKQSNGFLYSLADSSINVIGNVQTAGSPSTTTLNNQNVDPQTGTSWPSTLQTFGNSLIFANPIGVFELKGGAATKISDDLNGVFENADFSTLAAGQLIFPSAAVMTIYDVRIYMLLLRTFDPLLQAMRNLLFMWDGKDWFVGSQDLTLNFIATREVFSILQAWGTDGTNIFPMFSTLSTTLNKRLQTKLWSGDNYLTYRKALREFLITRNQGSDVPTFDGTIDILSDSGSGTPLSLGLVLTVVTWINFLGQPVQWVNSLGLPVNWFSGGTAVVGSDSAGATGLFLGMTLHTTASKFVITAGGVLYQDVTPFGG